MNDTVTKSEKDLIPGTKNLRNHLFSIIGIILGSLLILIILLLTGVTLYLTPERITRLINENASKFIEAKVKVANVEYSFWSTFPRLNVRIDSISVVIDKASPQLRQAFTNYNDTLFSATQLSGGIHLFKLFKKDLDLNDIIAKDLSINIARINDSINNYSIIPPKELKELEKFKIKGLSLSSLSLKGNTRVKVCMADPAADILLSFKKLDLSKDKAYKLMIDGDASASIAKSSLLDKFPFHISGNILLNDNLDDISLKDFNINLGQNLAALMFSASFGNKPVVEQFTYAVSGLDVASLIKILPDSILGVFPPMKVDMKVNSNGKLNAPLHFQKGEIPSFTVSLSTNNGSMKGNFNKIPVALKNLDLDLLLNIAENNSGGSSLDISRLSGSFNGQPFSLSVSADNLLGLKSDINASFDIKGDLNFLSQLKIKGFGGARQNFEFKAKTRLTINRLLSLITKGFNDANISDMGLDASLYVDNINASLPGSLNAKANNADIQIKAGAGSYKSGLVSDLSMNLLFKLKNGNLNTAGTNTNIKNLSIAVSNDNPFQLRLSAPFDILPSLRFSVNLAGAGVKMNPQNTEINVSNLNIDHRTVKEIGETTLTVGKLKESGKNQKIETSGLSLEINTQNKSVKSLTDLLTAKKSSESAGMLFDNYNLSAQLGVAEGKIVSPAFPSDNTFRDIKISINPNSVNIRKLRAHTAGCRININGNISGLYKFLSNDRESPLKLRMNLDIDTLDLNKVAWVYENGVANLRGKAATLPAPKPSHPSASDSVPMAIPQYIDALLNASARHLIYTDLDLTDISTMISVKNGNATLGNLKLHAPFAAADISVTYSSTDTARMYLAYDADIDDVDLTRFFDCYRNTLLKAMPYMSNLAGILSVKSQGKIYLFPANFFDIPSLKANLNFQGRELYLHQNHFIKKIARLLLIRKKGDINIHNIDINANVHDNLVEVDPFVFEIDPYKLVSGGLNNFDGDMFYHIGVVHSPIPFRFGVNLLGSFSHPRIRFGGHNLKPEDSEKVTSEIMERPDPVNLPMNLKYYFFEFLKKAAADYEGK